MYLFFKLLGILCILLSSILAGLEWENRLKRRWLFLRETAEMLEFLIKEMVYHRTPICESLRETAKRCQYGFGEPLQHAADRMALRDGTSFDEIWSEAIHNGKLPRLLSAPELGSILELSGAFCNADTVMQKTRLETCRDHIILMSRETEHQYHEKGALYRKLSAAAGIFLALILI